MQFLKFLYLFQDSHIQLQSELMRAEAKNSAENKYKQKLNKKKLV